MTAPTTRRHVLAGRNARPQTFDTSLGPVAYDSAVRMEDGLMTVAIRVVGIVVSEPRVSESGLAYVEVVSIAPADWATVREAFAARLGLPDPVEFSE